MSTEEKRIYHREWQRLHKEEGNARRRAYYAAHRDEIIARSKEYQKSYKESHKEHTKQYWRMYWIRNKDRITEKRIKQKEAARSEADKKT